MMEEIIEDIERRLYLSPNTVKSLELRSRTEAIARQLVCYLARTYTPLSLNEITRAIGYGDHTTVMYSINTVRDILNGDRKHPYQRIVRNIVEEYNEQAK